MYTQNQFVFEPSRNALEKVYEEYQFAAGTTVAEAKDQIENLIFRTNVCNGPKLVVNRTFYSVSADSDVLSHARFIIKPSVSDALVVKELRKEIEVIADKDFYHTFLNEVADFIDEYKYYERIQANLVELNEIFLQTAEENEIPMVVQFTVGHGIVDADDNSALIGLSEETIRNLGSLALFDEYMEVRRESYKTRILETLKELTRPFEIVKVNTMVTKDLDIYTRKTLHKLIRAFVKRKEDVTRVGVGYVNNDEVFAVVRKTPVTEQELENYDLEKVVVYDNVGASKAEVKAAKTKIVVEYVISPFQVETGIPVDVKLEELIAVPV